MHAATGALAGGIEGAIGAGTVAASAPMLTDLQNNVVEKLKAAGVNETVAKGAAQVIATTAAAALGAATTGGSTQGAAVGMGVDANNRQLHQDGRDWAKKNAKKYQEYLGDKTGEKITSEDAYQRLLSAGYAMMDDAAAKGGKSDESAKQFINGNAPKDMFKATAAERANPFVGGNLDGSFTPEQQARFGASKPGEQASAAVTNAMQYVGQPCSDCRNKAAAIDNAVVKLQEARVLYQDDPGSVKLIDQQIDQLKTGITRDELARGMAGVISDKDKGIAALMLGMPTRVVAGSATSELLERIALTQAIKDVRVGLPTRDLRTKGNVAAAQINIPGLPLQMTASSRVDTPAYGLVGEGSQNFTYMKLPSADSRIISRNTDSEYKILDNIADQLGKNTSANGSITIVTERPACGSCLSVVDQFRARYPNIEVKVFDNTGIMLMPLKQPIKGK